MRFVWMPISTQTGTIYSCYNYVHVHMEYKGLYLCNKKINREVKDQPTLHHNQKKIIFRQSMLVLLIFFSWLASCNSPKVILPTLPVPLNSSYTPSLPSSQPLISTPIPGQTAGTLIPLASPSPLWKLTFTSRAEATQTAAVFINQTQEAIYLLTNTAIVNDLQKTVTPHRYQRIISPNGQYRADFIVYDCTQIIMDTNPYSLETLKITDLNHQMEWVVNNRMYYCGGEGWGGKLGGLFWSNNSRYFYYTENWDDRIKTFPTRWINLTYRYDTSNRENLSLSGMALSLDRLKIAAGDGRDLVIWDLNGYEIARFQGKNIVPDETSTVWLHYLAWSPDDLSIAYILTKQSTNWAISPNISFVVIANMDMKQSSLLFEADTPEFIEVHWKDQNHLSLLGDVAQSYSNWEYSIVDKSLTPEVEPTNTSIP